MLNATGFDVELEGNQSENAIVLMRAFDAFVPALCSALAIWAIYSFSITEEKARDVRRQLEDRRGKLGGPAPEAG
jgi:GPH family glycoside/pentoside/hexuronide:cation symporter